ncbi:hypothetical protein INS49_013977 [Diaporthe citri]|uniref:uncharacterized protein n=1 Tax=Diaporthe citri TaxID=83186 RepID=UPI001C7E32ED|nr:uncharacterized protein INS49_013977 [Diaporthe citri]KAG6358093.1 hypothetical protein INS49_013977 [Diaporthe citri]
MLLDEADVFLEKRTISDPQRNSLVSGLLSTASFTVFLRIVEYYRGILFLTTNRVGQFDDAFISRIHTVIHHENFSNDEQDRIWTQFFKKLEKERRKDTRIDRSAWKYVFESKDLRKIEWNGRQIRNAVAFAEYRFLQLEDKEEGEKASLEDQDFARVCEMTIAFQGYMTSVHGGDESRRARNERIRDDKFKDGSSSF